MSVEIQDLRRDSFPELVSKSKQPVIIDFWGPQCGPCLALAPHFHDLAEKYSDLAFFRVEAPASRMLCVDLKVMSLPTFLCLMDGVEVSRLDGQVRKSDLARWVGEQSERAKGGNV